MFLCPSCDPVTLVAWLRRDRGTVVVCTAAPGVRASGARWKEFGCLVEKEEPSQKVYDGVCRMFAGWTGEYAEVSAGDPSPGQLGVFDI